MRIIKTVVVIVIALLLGLYGYYSFLSYEIYENIATYKDTGNKMAVEFSTKIIVEKYPYSACYYLCKPEYIDNKLSQEVQAKKKIKAQLQKKIQYKVEKQEAEKEAKERLLREKRQKQLEEEEREQRLKEEQIKKEQLAAEKIRQKQEASRILKEQLEHLEKQMVYVEGGKFKMGGSCKWAKPKHLVTVPSFKICKYEVTRILWNAVTNKPQRHKYDQWPIEKVTWEQTQLFLKNLNKLTGKRYRLPSEAEWEYAARGGNKSEKYKYSGGNSLKKIAIASNSYRPQKVGTKHPNELGLFDMTGNLWEICEDNWHQNYKGAPTDGSAWKNRNDSHHIVRGGGYNATRAWYRVSWRAKNNSSYCHNRVGFRLAHD